MTIQTCIAARSAQWRASVHRVDRQCHCRRRAGLVGGLGEVRCPGNHVRTNVGGQLEMVAVGVGDQQRAARCPPFVLAVGLDHARTRRSQPATQHQAVSAATQSISQRCIRERKRIGLPRRILWMARIAPGLSEAHVGGHPACARDVRHQSVENRSASQILVESEIQEVAEEAPGLRHAETNRTHNSAAAIDGQRVIRPAGPPQERHDIARRRKAYAEHDRVASGVGHFIQCGGVEPG